MTRRARRMRATASATARAGLVGGCCTRSAVPGWTVARSVPSRDAAARTAFHDATSRKTARDSACRRATAGAWSTCTVTRGSVAISGGSSVSSYPTSCTSAPLSASARAWYSMRGLRPRSPSTTTVTRKRGMEKAGVIAHPPRTLHGRRIAIAGGGTEHGLAVLASPGRASEIEGSGQVAHVAPDARQRFEIEPPRDQLQDRGRVVARVIDEAALRERRDDDRWNARPGSPAIPPGRWHV